MGLTDPGNSSSARDATRNPWLGVELRHLNALVAVAREGSFRAAAGSLGYVQSAVSQQVAQLERVVGQRLVERERGAVPGALTPAGELLLGHAELILSRFGAAQADLEVLGKGGLARLRVGACASLAAGTLPRLLPALLGRSPGLEVTATEASADELTARIAEGSLDAAFAELPLPDGPFASTDLCADPYVLVGREDDLPDEPLLPADLEEVRLIDHPLMKGIEPRLRAASVVPRYGLHCDSLSALLTLVGAGLGSAVVPRMFGTSGVGHLATASLDEVISPRRVCIFCHADRQATRTIQLLVELATWVFGPLGPDARLPGPGGARVRAAA